MATFGTITADGDTSTVFCEGPFSFIASGTWGSGTFVVYIKSRDGTWKALTTDTALTSDATGQITYEVHGGHELKATLSGSSGASLNWEFYGKWLIER